MPHVIAVRPGRSRRKVDLGHRVVGKWNADAELADHKPIRARHRLLPINDQAHRLVGGNAYRLRHVLGVDDLERHLDHAVGGGRETGSRRRGAEHGDLDCGRVDREARRACAARLRNTTPNAITTIASTRFSRCFQSLGMKLDAVPNANSSGNVPSPKASMATPPLSTPPVAAAASSAPCSGAQGISPVSRPKATGVASELCAVLGIGLGLAPQASDRSVMRNFGGRGVSRAAQGNRPVMPRPRMIMKAPAISIVHGLGSR